MSEYAQDHIPGCEHWMLGDIAVDENGRLHTYKRAILVTFKTIEEYRAALKYFDPVFSATSAWTLTPLPQEHKS